MAADAGELPGSALESVDGGEGKTTALAAGESSRERLAIVAVVWW